MNSTLISEGFSAGFLDLLEKKGCIRESALGSQPRRVVDMKALQHCLDTNNIDVGYLNGLLRIDNEFEVEGDEEDLKRAANQKNLYQIV